MTILALQYLEGSSTPRDLPLEVVRSKLQQAVERLPISMVMLGWNLPDPLIDVCAAVSATAGVKLYRWHPLLTGDGVFVPLPEWRVIGLNGEAVPGYRNLPEFTFVCPNRPKAQQAVLARLQTVLLDERFQGIFLDRIRFPSPAVNPGALLGCFCGDCRLAAAEQGLDLDYIWRQITELISTPAGAAQFVLVLLSPGEEFNLSAGGEALTAFLRFRSNSISRFLAQAADIAHQSGVEVGLDCFSTALTRMVGQELSVLDAYCEWMKLMTYGHTMAPSGLPYELLGIAEWLLVKCGYDEAETLASVSRATQLPLPATTTLLREQGLSAEALGLEVEHAHKAGANTILAGIELVDLPGITRLSTDQIRADLAAFKRAGADGFALSWDLWHISDDKLDLVRESL